MLKKILSLLLVLSFLAMPNAVFAKEPAFDPFAGDLVVNVAYIGGSITCGSGSSDANQTSWVAKVSRFLESTYGEGKQFNHYNAGIGGTGSALGMMRLKDEVISKMPDMVFVEFAVNDSGSETALWQMESIVMTLQQMPTTPYIVFVLTTADYLTGSDYQQYHRAVADYYGIPVIDLDAAVRADSSVKLKEILPDGVHPNDTGYAFYAEVISEALLDPANFVRPEKKEAPLSEKARSVDTKALPVRDLIISGTEGVDYAITAEGIVLMTPGTSISGYYEGDAIVIKDVNSPQGGTYKVAIDGVNVGSKDTYLEFDQRTPHYGVLHCDIAYDWHEITVTMLKNDRELTDPQVVIRAIQYNAAGPDADVEPGFDSETETVTEETAAPETEAPETVPETSADGKKEGSSGALPWIAAAAAVIVIGAVVLVAIKKKK